MALGLLFFFGFLVFAINVTYNLYATSVVTSLALDAARDVAEGDGLTAAEAEAEFRSEIGGDVDFAIAVDAEVVRVTVKYKTRALMPQLSDSRAFGVIDRTFEVRREMQQA